MNTNLKIEIDISMTKYLPEEKAGRMSKSYTAGGIHYEAWL